MLRRRWWVLVFLLPALASAQTALKERELAKVRGQIQELSAELAKKNRERSRLHDEVESAEAALGRARERLTQTDNELDRVQQRLVQVRSDEARRRKELSVERDFLARQLRALYVSGRNERLRLLLNQQDPAELGRRTTYYRYLNSNRQQNITRVSNQLAELAELRARTEAAEADLEALSRRRRDDLAREQAAMSDRAASLAKLSAEIATQGGMMDELKAREADLDRLVSELNGILEDYPISTERPFAELRGALTWPVAGRRLHDFGQPRDGSELTWNGVVLATDRGTEVRAIYHGRVAYAEWLPRLGLLIVLDHGDGYLSLYGHNDSLLRAVGDWVGAGDVIATVGDSGGQIEPALYLELRRGRETLNPNRWIRRRPGQK
ncbi:MAG: peptidoglycan DD-metalloendopeptidase family protein [Pseudomonadota bacterium]